MLFSLLSNYKYIYIYLLVEVVNLSKSCQEFIVFRTGIVFECLSNIR